MGWSPWLRNGELGHQGHARGQGVGHGFRLLCRRLRSRRQHRPGALQVERPSHRATTMVATPLPIRFVIARASDMNRSIPRINAVFYQKLGV